MSEYPNGNKSKQVHRRYQRVVHVLYTIGIASVFYPSERLLKIRKDDWMVMDKETIQDRIFKEYN